MFVQILDKGRVVPPSTTIEIKSRAVYRRLRLDEVIPQLWFERTPILFVCFHKNIEVQDLSKLLVKSEFERWEKRNPFNLKKFVPLLKKLGEVVRTIEGKRCVIVCKGENVPSCVRRHESNK